VKSQTVFAEPLRQYVQHAAGVFFTGEANDEVVRIAHQEGTAFQTRLYALCEPQVTDSRNGCEKFAASRLEAGLKHVCYRKLPESFNPACWLSQEGRNRLDVHRLWQTDGGDFIPTRRQQRILDLLNGQAKKLAQLADTLGVQPSTLSGRDLKELKERGRIRHDKRVGYWRPDAPPPHLAVT
jgi:hypothetical protein